MNALMAVLGDCGWTAWTRWSKTVGGWAPGEGESCETRETIRAGVCLRENRTRGGKDGVCRLPRVWCRGEVMEGEECLGRM